MDEVTRAKYIAFGTYRQDGSIVSTPTWVVPFREGYAFTTELGSWKTKRLARNHRVAVTPSDFRGRALVGAATYQGQGELLEGPSALEVELAVRRKYRLTWIVLIASRRLARKILRKPKVVDCAVYFVLVN
jgi:PPOX class probable F420-dependent enzyme